MVTNPMIANLKLIPGAQPTVSEDSELEPTSLLQRIEVLLRKACASPLSP